METNEFGIKYKIEGLGYVDSRLRDNLRKNLHANKHIAGKHFHQPFVKSVCVYDNSGTACLYLKKTENGIVREERDPVAL